MRIPLGPWEPEVDPDAWVAPGAVIAGAVSIGRGASVWFGCTLRADGDRIAVGAESNIQDGVVVHADPGYPVEIAQRVSVGHGAVLHGCRIGAGSLVGMRAVVLNGARIGGSCLVAAGSVVLEGADIEPGTLVAGAPARVRRELTDEERAGLDRNAEDYLRLADRYRTAIPS